MDEFPIVDKFLTWKMKNNQKMGCIIASFVSLPGDEHWYFCGSD